MRFHKSYIFYDLSDFLGGKSMYTGSNPTALRSRAWLKDAFLDLLKEEKYSEITVTAICRRAHLSRQTFYQIFSSKDEVMHYQFSCMFIEFRRQHRDLDQMQVKELVTASFYFFYKERDFFQELIDNGLNAFMVDEFEHYLPQISCLQATARQGQHLDYSAAYLAGAITQILIHWFQSDFSLSIEEISGLVTAKIKGKWNKDV